MNAPSFAENSVAPLSTVRQAWRLVRVVFWLLGTALHMAAVYPFLAQDRRDLWTSRHSERLLNILNIRVEQSGTPPPGWERTLVVANHVSWLDPLIMLSCYPMSFIGKAEIRRWPVIGRMAANAKVVFIKRGSHEDALIINNIIKEKLSEGGTVAFFPEAYTSDGRGLLPFKTALFQAALDADGAVVPLALRYYDGNGRRTTQPAFVGDMGLWESFRNIAAMPELKVKVDFLPVVYPDKADATFNRFMLAKSAEQHIAKVVEPEEADA